MSDKNTDHDTDGSILVSEEVDVAKPKLFKVIMMNDDFTPMDFVVNILEGVFERTHTEAMKVMLEVHQNGRATAGIYPKSIAETKVLETMKEAKAQQYPLQCQMESQA